MILNPNDRLDLPSASQFEQLMLCPGSWNAQHGLAELADNDEMRLSGNRVHEALQYRTGEDSLDSPRERWIYTQAVGIEEKLVNMLVPDSSIRQTEIRLPVVHQENVDGQSQTGIIGSGRFDVLYLDPEGTKALIIDYKVGPIEVTHAVENIQVRGLGVAVWDEVLEKSGKPLEELYGAIVQPAAEEQFSVVRYSELSIAQAKRHVTAIIFAAWQSDAPRIAGDKQCRYCRAKATCPEAKEMALATIPELVHILKVGRKEVVELPELTPSQWAETLAKIPFAQKVLKAMQDRAKEMLDADPYAIPGFGLKPGNQIRHISDNEKAREILGVAPEDFIMGVCTVSATKLQEAYAESIGKKPTAKGVREQFDKIFDEVIRRVQNRPSLTQMSINDIAPALEGRAEEF